MKTIVLLASRISHIINFANIKKLPKGIRSNANFIILINQDLYQQVFDSYHNLCIAIKPIPVNYSEDGFSVRYDLDSLKSEIDLIIKKYDSLYFIAPDEVNIEHVETILRQYNLPVWCKGTAKICRNKILMKDFMSKHAIRVPKYKELKSTDTFENVEKHLGVPFIIKPVDSLGSVGVELIRSKKQFDNLIIDKKWHNFTYEAEEFIEGDLYHIDTVKYLNNIYCTISKYTSPQAEFRHGKIQGSIKLLESCHEFECLSLFNTEVINALDNDGCFHHEVFINKQGEPIFLEIAWRQAGLPVTTSFDYTYGYPQTLLYICSILADAPINLMINQRKEYTVEYWAPKMCGTYHGIELPKLCGDVKIEHMLPLGAQITNSACGYFDIATKIYIAYPDLEKHYDNVVHDFNTIREIALISEDQKR